MALVGSRDHIAQQKWMSRSLAMLVLTGLWEVFVAPHVLTAIFGHALKTH